MLESLETFDKELFVTLNGLHHPAMDPVMTAISGTILWLPLYALLLYLLGKRYGWRALLVIVPLVAVVVLLADQTSVHLFKNQFLRFRPCKNAELAAIIHNPVGCGGWYGFVSSHATNTFAIAMFVSLLLKQRAMWIGLLCWAALVSYSRIYLGKHYPADLVGGAALGALIGWLVSLGFPPLLARLQASANAVTSKSE